MTGCIELFHTRSWKGAVAVVGGCCSCYVRARERERWCVCTQCLDLNGKKAWDEAALVTVVMSFPALIWL